MRLPVDISVVSFVSAGPAEPSLDFTTKQQRTDVNGVPLNRVDLFAVGEGGTKDVITVKVPGQFTPVKVTDLVATTWSMKDPNGTERTGVSFSASKVETIATQRPAAAS